MRPRTIVLGVLCLVQLWGTAVAVTLAAREIETIVVTGPIFAVLGLLVVLAGVIDGRSLAVCFGLSVALLSLFVFLLINVKGWGPQPAAVPVALILLGYELAVLPLGLVVLYGILSRRPTTPSRALWQFNVRTMLALTLVAAVDFAIVRLIKDQGATTLVVLAVGLGVATLLTSAVVIAWALYRRAAEPAPE